MRILHLNLHNFTSKSSSKGMHSIKLNDGLRSFKQSAPSRLCFIHNPFNNVRKSLSDLLRVVRPALRALHHVEVELYCTLLGAIVAQNIGVYVFVLLRHGLGSNHAIDLSLH